jgi:CrcB protein
MSLPMWIGVAALGGLGAVARYVLGTELSGLTDSNFPVGTFVVNITGAFLLGVVSGLAVSENLSLLLGAGALGGYTTFSTWMLETRRLSEAHRTRLDALYLIASLILGLLLVWLGRELGEAL